MQFEVRCPQCDHATRLPAIAAGTQRVCLNCGAKILVPPLQSKAADIPFAEVVSPEAGPRHDGPFVPPAVHDSNNAPDDPNGGEEPIDFAAANASQVNPFASPQTIHRRAAAPDDEPIEFAPAVPDPFNVHVTPRNPALAFSSSQLRDALRHAGATRGALNFMFVVLLIGLVLQIIIVVATAAALGRGLPPEARDGALLALAVYIVSALFGGVMVALIRDYSLRLGDFLIHKRADDLIDSLASANRYWRWSCFIVASGFVFGVIVVLMLIALK